MNNSDINDEYDDDDDDDDDDDVVVPIETEEEKEGRREGRKGRRAQSPPRNRETLFLPSVPLFLIPDKKTERRKDGHILQGRPVYHIRYICSWKSEEIAAYSH